MYCVCSFSHWFSLWQTLSIIFQSSQTGFSQSTDCWSNSGFRTHHRSQRDAPHAQGRISPLFEGNAKMAKAQVLNKPCRVLMFPTKSYVSDYSDWGLHSIAHSVNQWIGPWESSICTAWDPFPVNAGSKISSIRSQVVGSYKMISWLFRLSMPHRTTKAYIQNGVFEKMNGEISKTVINFK